MLAKKLAKNKIFDGYEVELIPLRFFFFPPQPLPSIPAKKNPPSLLPPLPSLFLSFFYQKKNLSLFSKFDGRSLIQQGGSSDLLDDLGEGEKSTHFLLFVLDQSAAEFSNGAWFDFCFCFFF